MRAKPRILLSRCLGFGVCRWDGAAISDEFIERLKGLVDFVTVCPEAEIGLGVPRDPVRIIIDGRTGARRLVQLNTGRDVTKDMKKFASAFVASLGDNIDGFILKDRSSSCGIKGVKAYRSLKSKSPLKKTIGFFADEVTRRFPGLAIESETRLSNNKIREHFLTRVFARAALRAVKKRPSIGR